MTVVKGRENLHSIEPPTDLVPFGSKVIISCNYSYSQQLIKKVLFCGYDHKKMIYRLLGDAPECPGIYKYSKHFVSILLNKELVVSINYK